MIYKINISKDITELTDSEVKELAFEFEEKFLKFKKELAKEISCLDAVMEYADRYDLDTAFVGELVSFSEVITKKIEKELNHQTEFNDDEW